MNSEEDPRTLDFPDFTSPLPLPQRITGLLHQIADLYDVKAQIGCEAFNQATVFPRFDVYVSATHEYSGFRENTEKFMHALHAHIHDFLHARSTSLPRAVHKTHVHDIDRIECDSEEERMGLLEDIRSQDITTDTMLGKITHDGEVSSLEFSLPYSRSAEATLVHWLKTASQHPPRIIKGTGEHTSRLVNSSLHIYEPPRQQQLDEQQAAQRQ